MWKSNDKKITAFYLLNKKKALSLVELVVITFIIAVIATMAFPTYKIFQQRSKEKRLKKILTDVRAAINGTKSHNSTNYFEEGFRTVARVEGMKIIENAAAIRDWDSNTKQKCINLFIAKIGEGHGYPKSPKDIWSNNPSAEFSVTLTGFNDADPSESLSIPSIPLNRPFYRNCDVSSGPVHPFHDWYQTANFAYVPATDTNELNRLPCYTYEQWYSDDYNPGLNGVKDIVSRGVGLALDGSNTDEW